MPNLKIFESEDGLVTTKIHGMGQDAYVVTEDRVNSFNNYSHDFQIWLTLFSIALGLLLGNLKDTKTSLFLVSVVLVIIFGFFLFLAEKRFRKIRKSLFLKTNKNQTLIILEAQYGALTTYIDITEKLNNLIQNGKLNVIVSNDIDYDPLPGVVKNLKLKYSFENKTYEKVYNEGEIIVLP